MVNTSKSKPHESNAEIYATAGTAAVGGWQAKRQLYKRLYATTDTTAKSLNSGALLYRLFNKFR